MKAAPMPATKLSILMAIKIQTTGSVRFWPMTADEVVTECNDFQISNSSLMVVPLARISTTMLVRLTLLLSKLQHSSRQDSYARKMRSVSLIQLVLPILEMAFACPFLRRLRV